MLEPELYLFCCDACELRFELLKALCGGVSILLEGGLQDVELLRSAPGAVVLCFELTETREALAAVLKPLGNLGGCDAELLSEMGFLGELWIGLLVEGLEQGLLLRGGDAPFGLRGRGEMGVGDGERGLKREGDCGEMGRLV